MTAPLPERSAAREALAEIGRRFYGCGWVMGTSGNLSAVVSTRPLRLLITPSGAHKGRLQPADLLEIDRRGRVASGRGRASAETRLHLAVVDERGARAVLHTHSVWATILSRLHLDAGGLSVSGYEMLKGLDGVGTHEHREWIPILANDQDLSRLARRMRAALRRHPGAHGLLLAGHGLYTWGDSTTAAERHVEVFEFLFDVIGRTMEARHGTRENPR
jgi:methylthioribulose-1-phosphate dehydratase